MLTAFSILLAATAPTPAKNPDAEIIEALRSNVGGSCVMFVGGACVCANYQAYVRDLNCSETEAASERICSYNFAMSDTAGIDAPYAYQVMDVICPLLSGPKLMIFWTTKEIRNAEQEASPGRDYRQAT